MTRLVFSERVTLLLLVIREGRAESLGCVDSVPGSLRLREDVLLLFSGIVVVESILDDGDRRWR